MFPLGHLGIGQYIVRPWSRGLRIPLIYLGTLLPDLIDKPLYYGLSFYFEKKGADLGLISTTRTLGHTGIFALLLLALTYARKSKLLAAFVLGLGSHLLIDSLWDVLEWGSNADFIQTLLWPFRNPRFPATNTEDLEAHLQFWHRPWILYSEIFGAALLYRSWKKPHP